jgi:hypothetical protein
MIQDFINNIIFNAVKMKIETVILKLIEEEKDNYNKLFLNSKYSIETCKLASIRLKKAGKIKILKNKRNNRIKLEVI